MSYPKRTTTSQTMPAPVGGYNTRDPLDFMPEVDARELVNFYPRSAQVSLRKGYTLQSEGMGSGAIRSLYELSLSSGTRQLIAATGGKLYNATVVGGMAAEIGTGFSSDDWQASQFRNRLFLVNGSDSPQDWDGVTLTATAWAGSGLTPSDLIHVSAYRNRLYFTEKDSGSVWYSGVDAVTGTLTEFDVLSLLNLGGFVLFTTQWTRDTGTAESNQFIIIGSEGDVLIYNGSFPGNSDWQISRRLTIPTPLGRRAFDRVGSDVLITTEAGIISLTSFLSESVKGSDSRITEKIDELFRSYVEEHRTKFGWQVLLYPAKKALYCNIPTVTDNSSLQVVFNTETGAPTLFEGMDASCWAIYDRQIYFGGVDGKVYRADNGTTDNGAAIQFRLKTAFNFFGDRAREKRLTQVRPQIRTTGSLTFRYGLDTNFQSYPITDELTISLELTPWGSPWGSSWSQANEVSTDWYTAIGNGKNVSFAMQGSASGVDLALTSIQIVYEMGGVL
jgi:hypothetical protein